jgi:hypothetical protein
MPEQKKDQQQNPDLIHEAKRLDAEKVGNERK